MNPAKPYKNLVCAMVLKALQDMERGAPGTMPNATIWLATRSATRWFDMAGVDQLTALRRKKWYRHAQTVLREDLAERMARVQERYRKWKLDDDEKQFLRKMIRRLEP